MSEVVSFLGSFTSTPPATEGPLFAFWGRSNVGKSSLINNLFKSAVARVSHNPGRTQTLNYFTLNKNKKPIATYVDMPGYGYAKVSRQNRNQWLDNSTNFIVDQKPILFLLIDGEVGLKSSDLEMIDFLVINGVIFNFIITKTDKAKGLTLKTQESIQALLISYKISATILQTSSKKNLGFTALKAFIRELNNE